MFTLALCVSVLGQLALNMDAATQSYRCAREAGQGTAVVMGDSLVYREGAIWENLVEISTSQYGSGGPGYQGVSVWTGAVFSPSFWTPGVVNADVPPHWSLDGLWLSTVNTTSPASVICTPWSRTTTLHYVTGPGSGSFTVTSGPCTWDVPAGGIQGVGTLALNLPQNSLTINTHGNGRVTLLGFVNTNGTSGPVIHRVANGGWGLDEVVGRNWTFDAQFAMLNPQVVFICYGGQNDWGFSWNTSLWGSYLRQVCDRVQAAVPSAGIVLVSNYASSADSVAANHLAELAEVQRSLALERGYGFVDLFHAGGAYDAWLDRALLDADGLHFTDAGGSHAAGIIHCAMDTAGACLMDAPCDSIDFNNDGIYPDVDDLATYLITFTGAPCPACNHIDFNRDGLWPDTSDIASFLLVFSGGPCD